MLCQEDHASLRQTARRVSDPVCLPPQPKLPASMPPTCIIVLVFRYIVLSSKRLYKYLFPSAQTLKPPHESSERSGSVSHLSFHRIVQTFLPTAISRAQFYN